MRGAALWLLLVAACLLPGLACAGAPEEAQGFTVYAHEAAGVTLTVPADWVDASQTMAVDGMGTDKPDALILVKNEDSGHAIGVFYYDVTEAIQLLGGPDSALSEALLRATVLDFVETMQGENVTVGDATVSQIDGTAYARVDVLDHDANSATTYLCRMQGVHMILTSLIYPIGEGVEGLLAMVSYAQ